MTLAGEHSRGWVWDGTRAAPLAFLVFSLLLLAACSDSPDTIAGSTSTTSGAGISTGSPGTTPSTLDANTEIVSRYQKFWEARFNANQAPPNPDLPALAEYATGEQLDQVKAESRTNLRQGLAIRRASDPVRRSSVKVIRVADDEATLQECAVDDDVVYQYRTGEVMNADVATHNVEATMRRVDGVWKLASARLLQRWEGVAGCALSGGS